MHKIKYYVVRDDDGLWTATSTAAHPLQLWPHETLEFATLSLEEAEDYLLRQIELEGNDE